MPNKNPKIRTCCYTKAIVICHGKSEWCITRYIYTNLHLPIKTYAKDKGAHSIQITSLSNLLLSSPFNSLKKLSTEYNIQTIGSGKKLQLVNFKLFIIMDTDDCTDQQKKDYISGQMFSNHLLSPYIVPIYNTPNLENVLVNAGLIRKIDNNEKGSYYSDTFPINKGKFTPGTLSEIKAFCKKIKGKTNSNLADMIDYFISLLNYI